MTTHEHVKWMAKKQADMDAKLDALAEKLEAIESAVAEG